MSTLELENIKHPDNSGNNIELAADGSIGSLNLSGNMGIGTNTPLRKLHLADAGDTHIILQSTNAVDNSEIFEIGAGANSASKVDLTFRTRLNSGSGGAEHMRITNDGYVKTPNQPAFIASNVSGNTLAMETDIVYVNAELNRGNVYNTSNGRFTAPIAGLYFVNAHMRIHVTTSTAQYTRLSFKKNGVYLQRTRGRLIGRTYGDYSYAQVDMVVELAANDYITVNGEGNAGTWNLSGMDENQIYGYLIG